jgi:hypothetical protein
MSKFEIDVITTAVAENELAEVRRLVRQLMVEVHLRDMLFVRIGDLSPERLLATPHVTPVLHAYPCGIGGRRIPEGPQFLFFRSAAGQPWRFHQLAVQPV